MTHEVTAFFLPMERVPTVTAQQAHRTTKAGHHYTDRRALDARALYRAMLAPHAPPEPLRGPVRLLVKFLFPLKGHEDGEYKITKPDTDNMIKILKDAMSDVGFWNDDAQVASETVEKFYSKITGVFVSVCVLPQTRHSIPQGPHTNAQPDTRTPPENIPLSKVSGCSLDNHYPLALRDHS